MKFSNKEFKREQAKGTKGRNLFFLISNLKYKNMTRPFFLFTSGSFKKYELWKIRFLRRHFNEVHLFVAF